MGYIAQMVVDSTNDDLEIVEQCLFEPAVRNYFSSNNVRFLAYVYRWRPTIRMIKA